MLKRRANRVAACGSGLALVFRELALTTAAHDEPTHEMLALRAG